MTRNRSLEVHAGWGAAIVLAAVIAGLPLAWALALGVAAGVACEVAQWAVPRLGMPDWRDAAYTAAGAAAAALFVGVVG